MAESNDEKPNPRQQPRSSGAAGVAGSAQSSFMSDDYFSSSDSDDDDFDWEADDKMAMRKADRLSRRLLAVDDNDHFEQDRILSRSLRLHQPMEPSVGSDHGFFDENPEQQDGGGSMMHPMQINKSSSIGRFSSRNSGRFRNMFEDALTEAQEKARRRIFAMLGVSVCCVILVLVLAYVGVKKVKPPMQPVGPYVLLERQEGHDFFEYYAFYEGPDSAGSNGYNNYVSEATAATLGIVNVTFEDDELDVFGRRHLAETGLSGEDADEEKGRPSPTAEPFVYMGSAATPDGPRQSIRLEGIRRFDRGLFILDVRHMPAGCGMWPAFWLTDEANWPINGEIDIAEGVNYQTEAKTALHSTKGCDMEDVPLGVMTGGWDTAQGIPDADTGVPDMTVRYAQNCFVYDRHQWLNQGCVAVDLEGGSIGQPLNKNGGGVYALEWDPINRHIRSWVFTPHEDVPENLVDAIRTAHLSSEQRTEPDPQQWPLPYGYFPIGTGTNCPSDHFQRMRLVFNTAFCGSVAGNRFSLDCPKQSKQFKSCNEWVKSNPDEMKEAYWKIRGVYVYQRAWEATLLN